LRARACVCVCVCTRMCKWACLHARKFSVKKIHCRKDYAEKIFYIFHRPFHIKRKCTVERTTFLCRKNILYILISSPGSHREKVNVEKSLFFSFWMFFFAFLWIFIFFPKTFYNSLFLDFLFSIITLNNSLSLDSLAKNMNLNNNLVRSS